MQLLLVRYRRSHRLPAAARAVKFANVHHVMKTVATKHAAMSRRPGKKLVLVKAAANDHAVVQDCYRR